MKKGDRVVIRTDVMPQCVYQGQEGTVYRVWPFNDTGGSFLYNIVDVIPDNPISGQDATTGVGHKEDELSILNTKDLNG